MSEVITIIPIELVRKLFLCLAQLSNYELSLSDLERLHLTLVTPVHAPDVLTELDAYLAGRKGLLNWIGSTSLIEKLAAILLHADGGNVLSGETLLNLRHLLLRPDEFGRVKVCLEKAGLKCRTCGNALAEGEIVSIQNVDQGHDRLDVNCLRCLPTDGGTGRCPCNLCEESTPITPALFRALLRVKCHFHKDQTTAQKTHEGQS